MERVDKYGHCVLCSKNLIVERVVDSQVINMMSVEYDEVTFKLDDNTTMRVCVCKKCKNDYDLSSEEVQNNIINAVINGWKLEVDALVADDKRPDWNKERGDNHMEKYSQRRIIGVVNGTNN